MYNIRNTIKRQCDFEGYSPVPYRDTLGYWSTGFGQRTYHGHPVNSFTPIITKAEALVSLKAGLLDAIRVCHRLYPNFNDLSGTQQEVLIHMAYQMGYRLRSFKQMAKAIAIKDAEWWAEEMTDSLWAKQTPRPYRACHHAILNDSWK